MSTLSDNFFKRDDDRSVRLRIRFSEEEADAIEMGAGKTPLILYIKRVLADAARRHAEQSREQMALPNPEDPEALPHPKDTTS